MNATVVLADADLKTAVGGIVAAAFGQAGQRCTATSRVLVESSMHEEVLALLVERLTQLQVGDGSDQATSMGPLVSTSRREKVMGFVDAAQAQGARLVTGGAPPDDEVLAHGCFLDPTVLSEVTPIMDIWRQEVFGPVVVVRPVGGLEEAIAEVNDSDFGLAAALFTTSLAAAYRFADQVDCGQVAVNTTTSGWDVHHPFGGFRESGSPFKEQGEEALHFYTRVKSVAIHVSNVGG